MVDFPYKILIPGRSDQIVSRPRLVQQLESIADLRLIAVSTPPGYGKTSLLIDFANTTPLPVCWYLLDSSDQDLWVFTEYLVASIESRFPNALKQAQALLSGQSQAPFSTVVAAVARETYAIGQDFLLILDDWHLVEHVPEISDLVSQLLLRCPNCHVILASRTYPSLPNMMLLAARRQMCSLDERHLRFTADEVRGALRVLYGTEPNAEQIDALIEQSHGWITGILLSYQAAVRLVCSVAQPPMLDERQIYRFLVEQVFDQQSPAVRSFLLNTSLLEELTSQNCDMLFPRNDTRLMLETLLRRNLFVVEIKPGVLRYHSMFREFLREHYHTIDSEGYTSAATHVAAMYASQGQWIQAFDQYIAVGRLDQAQCVIAASGEQLYAAGRTETLENWFKLLPSESLSTRLLCLKARVMLDRGNHQEAQTLADTAELRMAAEEEPLVRLLQAQLARNAGNYERALSLAERVSTSEQASAQRGVALRLIGICLHRLGKVNTAIEMLKEAHEIERQRGDLQALAKLQHDLGICYKDIGQFQLAEAYYTQADAYWATAGNLGSRVLSLNSKGFVQCLSGHYQEAFETLTMALQYAREACMPDYEAMVQSSLGDLYSDLQLWDLAQAAYADGRKIGGNAYMASYIDLASIRLLVRQRQFEAAARALRNLPDAAFQQLPQATQFVRISIACGLGQYEQAMCDIQNLIAQLEQAESLLDLARAYLLQAHIAAEWQPAEGGKVLAPLNQALAIAKRLGHSSFLVAETLHMRALLRRAAALQWPHAATWLERQQDFLLAAQALGHQDKRPCLEVRTLGIDQIVLDHTPVELGWNKAREVFYYLLGHPDGVPIDVLREAIWPDMKIERSRDTLRSAIYQLRSVLSRDVIELQNRQIYRINRAILRIDYDVERFLDIVDHRADDPEAILEAIDLYRGPYLQFTDSHWCLALRSQLEQQYLKLLHLIASASMEKQLYADALKYYQQILAVDMLDELAHAAVMRCQVALGNRAAAINQYQALRRILDEEYGLEPGSASEVERLYRHILAES